MLQNTLG